MGGTIFISYRRDVDAGFAGRLYDRLEHTFTAKRLFMDVDSIPPGQNFVSLLDAQVAECDVLLALIGRGWLSATDETGRRRLDNSDDFVRIEIAAGLARDKCVIPVLIDDMAMPSADELPEELKPLAGRQAVRIANDRFKNDAERLTRMLQRALSESEMRRAAPEQALPKAEKEQRREGGAPRKAEEQVDAAEINQHSINLAVSLASAAVSVFRARAAPSPPVREVRAIENFEVFRDVDTWWWCPEMVALPQGEFLMGSPESEAEGESTAQPQHRVRIGYRFALGRYPVTVGEFRRFAEATGFQRATGFEGMIWKCEKKLWGLFDKTLSWIDPGLAKDRHAALGVSGQLARAYVAWLTKETEKPYRLPSEAEWEYACRAETITRYSFGDNITSQDANFGGKVGKTTEVGSYPPNAWGLYDMHGNVWELVADRWHDSYQEAPTGGSAWLGIPVWMGIEDHVIRGGCWDSSPKSLCSARRFHLQGNYFGVKNVGFRVARTLS